MGKLITSNLDYDLPFIPVVMVIPPIRTGMCVPSSRSAFRAAGRRSRSPGTKAAGTTAAWAVSGT